MRSNRRSSTSNKKTPWRPRGSFLIPGHKVEPKKKGKGAKYNRNKIKFDNRNIGGIDIQ